MRTIKKWIGVSVLTAGMAAGASASADSFKYGWASVDITPEKPAAMRGSTLSAGVMDPITATALALEYGSEKVILISCDLQHITDGNRWNANMRDNVRKRLENALPDLKSNQIVLMATHTHVAPRVQGDQDYKEFASERIALAAKQAWENRRSGGISFGLGHAVTGHNRIAAYQDGSSRMVGSFQKGKASDPDFTHIEGFEDHSVHLLYTWDENKNLTGVVVNIACPAQVQRGDLISADFWHEAREEIRKRIGSDIFIMPQLSSAGDQATTVMIERKGEARMQRLMFPDISGSRMLRRKQIAVRIADAVTSVLPYMKDVIETNPVFYHTMEKLELPRGLTDKDRTSPRHPIEIHAVRIGDVAMVTNPFELYLDYGIRMKGRSPAVQTFVIQLAGSASYLPTARSVARGGYGAIPRTSIVGPVGGQQIVEKSLDMLNDLWRR